MFKAIKEWFNSLIKKIGQANDENLGSKRLDCCDLNQEQPGKK